MPRLIIDEFANGNRRGEFQAVGLFVDITGFSKMTNDLVRFGQHGAEVLAVVMRGIFTQLVCSVYENGGFITGYAGDSFTALFPMESKGMNAAEACLTSAWRIQQYMQENPIHSTQYGDFTITARAGIAHGQAVWGIIDSINQDRAAYYFRGSVVEECVYSETLAEPGDIILSEGVYQLANHFVSVETKLSHYRVKGVAEEIPPCGSIDLPELDLDISGLFYPLDLITQAQMGEFRQVINMFINLPTVRTEEQLTILMQTLFDLQDKYGGLLNRIDFGDKGSNILLFWGAPVAYGNDIGRALNFILALRTETSIPIKVGVTYRTAHAGFIGAPRREEYTCYGPGINLAARFMTNAPRGEIWIDEEIAKRVGRFFEIEFIDALSLKGFTEKQKVFVLHERKELFEYFYQGELIGREPEMARLTEFVGPLWRGEYTGAILAAGEAGIGKSRLIHEFLHYSETVKGKELNIALCHTDQVLRRSFNPFRYWLRRYFGVLDTQVESRNKRSFNQRLDHLIRSTADQNLVAELDRTRSFLGALVDLFWQDSLYEQLDPENRYENTLIGLIALMKAESKTRPLVIFLEDIHSVDADTRMLLSQLHRALTHDEETYPIAILATSRDPNLEQPLGNGVPFQQLTLEPLTESETKLLAQSYLDAPPGRDLSELLLSHGEGNPFFTEQLLSYLKGESRLVKQEGEWHLTAGAQAPIPADVRALLLARLDRFPKEIKQILLTAAVLGREFDVDVLAKMLKDEHLQQKMKHVEASAVCVPISDNLYIFKNNLLKDTAYQMQVHTRIRELHASALGAIEEVYAEDLRPYCYDLAYHAEHSGDQINAGKYLRMAAEYAVESYENLRAIEYFTKALTYLEDADLSTQIDIILGRGRLFGMIGKRDDQRNDFATARLLANQTGNLSLRAKAECNFISFHWLTGDYDSALKAAEETIRLANKAQEKKILVRGYIGWANITRVKGEYHQTLDLLGKARELASQIGDEQGECSILNNYGLLENAFGNSSEAIRYLEEGYEIAQRCGSLFSAAQALHNLGVISGALGDISSAIIYYQRALALSQKIGTRFGESLQRINLGLLMGLLGHYDQAVSSLKASLDLLRRIGADSGEAAIMNYLNLSLLTWANRDYNTANEYADEALRLAEEKNVHRGKAFAFIYKGHALAGLNQLGEACRNYDLAVELTSELDQKNLACEPLAGMAIAALLQDNHKEAAAYAGRVIDHIDQGGSFEGIDIPGFILAGCYRVMVETGSVEAEKFLEKAYQMIQDMAGRITDPAERGSFLKNVPWHAEIVTAYQQHVQSVKAD